MKVNLDHMTLTTDYMTLDIRSHDRREMELLHSSLLAGTTHINQTGENKTPGLNFITKTQLFLKLASDTELVTIQ